ncbi:CRISPR-associated endoribonuclease Cas6 [Meiothermus taiwanensis]|jgi:CRISPR-associated endoribonuclease Cas6|uniref:CRISPR-associated endoribonuclease Cas6 n=2 Tax=Meiothermus taiwanensis TaxID=172827 RepID=A0A399DXJ8_9DEIN|nr:CRISPR-associated endoribonuclease Cas6 [Meiothermus taiwanensis]AWR87975.1 CRISPR-associated protein, Cas6 [Meiothermus taiwanensis WR-220]KIQ54987.1 CRISPR-associated protein Cas6 [Meiothermus taiwanensis]KZK16974.1 CRISPR-associated protein Cas6 [Meiothermus taiwanensis]RIH76974.1 CRISPR-associated endoribonuclease Cas6 [Meiothermus taiwanensis]
MMLAALVLPLEGPGRPDPDGWRGLVYGLLRQIDPELHEAQYNPFSLGLGGAEGQWWVRIAFLDEGLYARLSPHLFGLVGQTVRLKEPFRVRAVLQEEHPWAGLSTYPRLFQGQAPASLGLHFASPTFFRRKGHSYPLPEPRLVFDSLTQRWNAFAPVKVPLEVQEAWERLMVGSFQGRTHRIAPNEDERGMGFVGRVVYFLPKASPTEAQWLQALGRFAFYAGVGAKTSLGFGRVRMFDPLQQERRPDEPEQGALAGTVGGV